MVCLTSDRLARLRSLSPRDFELLVADIWQERQGWDTEVTGPGADGGVDVLGYPPEGGAPTAVQVKRYAASKNVGRPQVQQYAALRQQYSDIEGVTIVTTSGFTTGAKQAAERLDVKLIDGETLCRIIDRYHAHEIVTWYLDGKPEVA